MPKNISGGLQQGHPSQGAGGAGGREDVVNEVDGGGRQGGGSEGRGRHGSRRRRR